ncbi:thioredoxin domain-containing protein [Candidatus Saccharibacteria bacterium]|nr:thioredoxin domain-containing protein [Candidatus Saccharibacteria bacterium]
MKRAGRIVALVLVFGAVFFAIVFSSVKPAEVAGKVWTESMVVGDPETAVRHYVVYTDLMCPYCNYYAKVIMDNDSEFRDYLSRNKIAYEVRVTDMLYESSGVELSRPAAEAAYCAGREGKFFEFYHGFLVAIFEDYYEKGIGNSKTAAPIKDIENAYFEEIAEEVGVSAEFKTCLENEETVAEVQEKTRKAATVAQGLPYFVFGKMQTGGFDPSWGWSVVRSMFDSGL